MPTAATCHDQPTYISPLVNRRAPLPYAIAKLGTASRTQPFDRFLLERSWRELKVSQKTRCATTIRRPVRSIGASSCACFFFFLSLFLYSRVGSNAPFCPALITVTRCTLLLQRRSFILLL